MFQTWLQQNTLTEVDFSTRLFPPATDRAFWEPITASVYIREAEAFPLQKTATLCSCII